MLNPSLQNFKIQFDDKFFPKEITKKYDDYLFGINHPFKTISSLIHESIQTIQIGGINIQPSIIQGLNNIGINPSLSTKDFPPQTTTNVAYEGNESWWNTLENTQFTITFRNNIFNYTYCYEMLYRRYLREKRTDLFTFTLCMMDSAEIDIIKITYSNCFIVTLPPLEFSFNQTFNESKQFDVTIQANKIDFDINIPEFNSNKIIL